MNDLVKSSANPKQLSLTIQGILVGLPAVLIALFQMLNIPISEHEVVEVIQMINAAAAMIVALWGAFRKMWNTMKNAVK